LLIDADESNYGLHRMLGISHPVSMLDNLEGKKLKTSFQEIDPICQFIEKFKKTFLTHKGTEAIKFNPA